MRVYVVRKWTLRRRSRLVCWNITRVSLWLLCKVNFVQSTQSNIATWPRWPKATDHCSSEEYWCTNVDACVARTWISYRCVPCHQWCTQRTSIVVKKKNQFPVAVNNSIKVGPLVFLLSMFVITENIMKRPVYKTRLNGKSSCIFIGRSWVWLTVFTIQVSGFKYTKYIYIYIYTHS